MATTSVIAFQQSISGAKKNAAFTLRLPFISQGANPVIKTTPTIAAGDVKVSKDGGAFANVATLPVENPGGGGVVEIALSASEMNADAVVVRGIDAAGDEWVDWEVTIYTTRQTVDDIEGAIRSNTAQAGSAGDITLDAGASAVDNFYTGCRVTIISGQGAGQARLISHYDGTTKVATVDRAWITSPSNTSVFQIIPDSLDEIIVKGYVSVDDVAPAATGWITDLTEATDNFWRGAMVRFRTGALQGQVRTITAYTGATKAITVDAFTAAPANGDIFDLIIGNSLLDDLLSSRASGTFYTSVRAAKLDNLDVLVSSRADGANYTGARATKLDNLDATISSRADAASYTPTRAGKLDNLDRLDVNVSTRADGANYTAGRAALIDNLDAAISSRANGAAYTVGRAALLDFLDAFVSSRVSSASLTPLRAANLDNLDALVSSRAPASQYTNARAALLDNLSRLDVTVSGRAAPGDNMNLAANAINSGAITPQAANKLADHTLRRSYTNAHASSDGDALTPRSLLGAVAKNVNRMEVAGNQLKYYHEDDTTVFGTQLVTATPGSTPITALGGAA